MTPYHFLHTTTNKEHSHTQKSGTGYTLIELVVAVGLFSVIMTLASGAYFVMINVNRQAQGITTGINNLSFALETMTRTIRTNTRYSCNPSVSASAPHGCVSGGNSRFYVTDPSGRRVKYSIDGTSIVQEIDGGIGDPLTDPSVTVSSLRFYVSGPVPADDQQARVTIVVSGTVSSGPGGKTERFNVETGATMRGTDL